MTAVSSPIVAQQRIYAVFNEKKPGAPDLSALCRELVDEQRLTWVALGRAYDSLEETLERTIRCTGFSVRVQRNPGRIASTIAQVDKGGTNGRPCFLCPGKLPADQRGILYRNRYLILPNPMPVLPFHCTVADIRHEPQAIAGRVETLLRLMNDLGRGWTVLYNGPRCGASAPDHFHFQIIPGGNMPVEQKIREDKRRLSSRQTRGARIYCPTGLGRSAVVIESEDLEAARDVFDAFLRGLGDILPEAGEPMLNACGFCSKEGLSLVIFPRRKHRPEAFFAQGADRIMVSPAILEMGGILVTPREQDFERLDGALVESIFTEVSLEQEYVEKALEKMKSVRSK